MVSCKRLRANLFIKARAVSARVTIFDVAKKANVSVSTVSRILSGTETQISFSEDTRQRVVQAARDLDYSPNPVARALRGKATNVLGLIVRAVDDPFYAQLIEAISSVSKEHGCDLMLGYAESDPETALVLSEILDPRRCDGLFVVGDVGSSQEEQVVFAEVERSHPRIAILCLGSYLPDKGLSISVDNRKGALLALDYLFRLGHREMAFLHGSRVGDLRERLEAYAEFMAGRLGGAGAEYIQSDTNSYVGGYQAMKRVLSLPAPPTAVFAADDRMAIGALKAASDMAYQVPRDVSVIGFDDIEASAYMNPSLTTIRQPIAEIGRRAVELVLEKVAENSVFDTAQQILMEPELVIRESCGPPPRRRKRRVA